MAAPVRLKVFPFDALPSSPPIEKSIGVAPRSSFLDIEMIACDAARQALDETRATAPGVLPARIRSFQVQIQILNLLPEPLTALAARQKCEMAYTFEPSDWSVFTLIVREKWRKEFDRKQFTEFLGEVHKEFNVPEKELAEAMGISQSRLSQLKTTAREASSAVYQNLGEKLEDFVEELKEEVRLMGNAARIRERLQVAAKTGRGRAANQAAASAGDGSGGADESVLLTGDDGSVKALVAAKRSNAYLKRASPSGDTSKRPKKPYGPRISYTDAEIEYIDTFVREIVHRQKGNRHLTQEEEEDILTRLNNTEERKKIIADGGPSITPARLATYVSNRKQKLLAEAGRMWGGALEPPAEGRGAAAPSATAAAAGELDGDGNDVSNEFSV